MLICLQCGGVAAYVLRNVGGQPDEPVLHGTNWSVNILAKPSELSSSNWPGGSQLIGDAERLALQLPLWFLTSCARTKRAGNGKLNIPKDGWHA